MHRVYTVFNGKQIDGIPAYSPRVRQEWETVQSAESILQHSGAKIIHDQDDRAFYNRLTDSIHLPPKGAFQSAGAYFGTALHEAVSLDRNQFIASIEARWSSHIGLEISTTQRKS